MDARARNLQRSRARCAAPIFHQRRLRTIRRPCRGIRHQGGARGSRDGTVIIIPEKRDPRTKKVLEPEKILVRKRYVDSNGRRREFKRTAENRTHARELLTDLRADARKAKVAVLSTQPSKTFADLAKFYEDEYLKPPKRDGEGLRSWYKIKSRLKALKEEFGDEPLRSIDYERIEQFRKRLIETPIVVSRRRQTPDSRPQTRPRSMASVNRPLQLLRRMLNLARQRPRNWISEDPFSHGEPLVRTSIETKRMRILSRDEEKRLLATVRTECDSGRADAKHFKSLYPAIIFAIDTAMRAGEQFLTRVSDVNLEEGFIRVNPDRAKTMQERMVPISQRLARELKQLKPLRRKRPNPNALIFDFQRPKRSFATALRNAKIENFRWHDLRHTGTMRMLDAGVDPATAMKVTGHTSWTTFMRYVNLNPELVRGVAAKMDTARKPKRRMA